MKNKIKYTNEPIEARVITDFLPKPEDLILKDKKTKVTVDLTQKSLYFFKKEAKKYKASYEKIMGRILDFYVANQANS